MWRCVDKQLCLGLWTVFSNIRFRCTNMSAKYEKLIFGDANHAARTEANFHRECSESVHVFYILIQYMASCQTRALFLTHIALLKCPILLIIL